MAAVRMTLRRDGSYQPPLRRKQVCPSSYNDFLAMVTMKPGMYLAEADVPTPGVPTPAPARDECLEALIIPTGRGEACVRPPVAP
uniref:XS domain containing protein-like n=1 Tax=Oryza sativa subsp. japonica TaxID=39947 RepID=Q5Z7J6_ORYSJ|nr:XS domain containing protein-like [Oryza sativa Japonica Group]